MWCIPRSSAFEGAGLGGDYECGIVAFGAIEDPEALAAELDGVSGVVEHGLFIGLASVVILGVDGSATVCLDEGDR